MITDDTMTHSDHVVAMETVSEELLNCPFCGGEARYQTDTEEEEFAEEWIGCVDCGATAAVEVWARRVPSELIASRLAKQAPAAIEDDYVIWSNERKLWWGPNSAGYRSSLALAGRYSRAEALELAKGARNGWTAEGNPDEIAVPLRDAEFCLPSPVLGEPK